MTALIIDDERLARAELRRLLAAHPDIAIAGEARDAFEAERLIAELHPDLLFLDVQMPERDGFQLLAALDEVPQVIFTTAYDEYALRAFEVSAQGYLLKPVTPERLAAALARLSRPAQAIGARDRIFVKDGERCWFVHRGEVVLLESEGNNTRLYFGAHRPLVLRSLNYLEQRLDANTFFRAGRRHIVNLRHIVSIDLAPSGGLMVRLEGGRLVEMSRRQAKKFKERMSL